MGGALPLSGDASSLAATISLVEPEEYLITNAGPPTLADLQPDNLLPLAPGFVDLFPDRFGQVGHDGSFSGLNEALDRHSGYDF